MQTLQQLLDKYAESHQNKTNKIIHYFCVPAIFFSVIGLLMSIPSNLIQKFNRNFRFFICQLGSSGFNTSFAFLHSIIFKNDFFDFRLFNSMHPWEFSNESIC